MNAGGSVDRPVTPIAVPRTRLVEGQSTDDAAGAGDDDGYNTLAWASFAKTFEEH
jgi:hypothetical protein